jgi:hypothetical protein
MTAIVGKAHRVEPALTVMDVQHIVDDCITVDAAQEVLAVAEFGAVQPSVGVEVTVVVEQKVSVPAVAQPVEINVAGAVEHSLDDEVEVV